MIRRGIPYDTANFDPSMPLELRASSCTASTIDPNIAFDILIFAAVFPRCQAIWNLGRVGVAKRVVQSQAPGRRAAASPWPTMVGELRKQRGLTERRRSADRAGPGSPT